MEGVRENPNGYEMIPWKLYVTGYRKKKISPIVACLGRQQLIAICSFEHLYILLYKCHVISKHAGYWNMVKVCGLHVRLQAS